MSKTKRLASLLSAVMLMGIMLTACSASDPSSVFRMFRPVTAESLMEDFAKKEAKANGISMSGTVNVGIKMTVFGQEESAKATGDLKAETKDNKSHIRINMKAETGGQEQTSVNERYSEINGDKIITYSKTDDEDWTREDIAYDMENLQGTVGLRIEDILGEELSLTEKEDEYIVSGEVDFTKLQDTLKISVNSLTDELLGEDIDTYLSDIPKSDVRFYFDKKSRDLTGYSVEMKDTIQGIFDNMIEKELQKLVEQGAAADDSTMSAAALKSLINIEVTDCNVDINEIKFDKSVKVEIPEAALSAKYAEDGATDESKNDVPDTPLFEDIEKAEESGQSETTIVTETPSVTEAPAATETPVATTTPSPATEPAATPNESTETVAGSNAWMDMSVVLNGETVRVGQSLKDLLNNGWTIETEKYAGSYILNPGDKMYDNIVLTKSGFNGKLYVSTVNETDKQADVKDCTIWFISYDGTWQDTPAKFELPGNVCNGMTVDEVQAVYGQAKDPYISEDRSYIEIDYGSSWEDEFDGKTLDLTFIDGKLTEFSLHQY